MPIPKTYLDIVRDITARIESGEYEPESKLPSYAALAERYAAGISTVSRAIALLRERGLVVGVPGAGTYVARRD